MRDAETIGPEFLPNPVNARSADYDANRIRWRHVMNVNETIEIKSLVSRDPNKILC